MEKDIQKQKDFYKEKMDWSNFQGYLFILLMVSLIIILVRIYLIG